MGTIELVKKEIRKMLKAQGSDPRLVKPTSKRDYLPNTSRIGQPIKKDNGRGIGFKRSV